MESTFKSGLKSEGFWIRIVFMIAYFILFRLLDILVILVSLAQCVFTLSSGKPNSTLAQFASGLAVFSKQIIDYLGFSSDQKPFPFQDWAGSHKVTDTDSDYQQSTQDFHQAEVTPSDSGSLNSETSNSETSEQTKNPRV